jgi:hypothetical protein
MRHSPFCEDEKEISSINAWVHRNTSSRSNRVAIGPDHVSG